MDMNDRTNITPFYMLIELFHEGNYSRVFKYVSHINPFAEKPLEIEVLFCLPPPSNQCARRTYRV